MRKCENRKLKGSVLLTVVAVMSILVVFLFGTLALALAANNRAHVNYSSTQTSITARTVAESVVRSINENPTKDGAAFANLIGEVVEGSDPVSVAVSINGDGTNTLGRIDPVTVSYAGTKKYYNVSKNEWEDRDLLKFTATVNMSGVTSTASVYALKYKQGDTPPTSGSGAGFVTTAGMNVQCQTSIFGGAYIDIPNPDDAVNYEYTDSHTDRGYGKIANAPVNSYYENSLTLWNSDGLIEADMYVNDNVFLENWSGFIFPHQGTGIAIMGDLVFSNNSKDHLKYIYNGGTGDIAFNKIPFLYVDGQIRGKDGVIAIGDKEHKFPFNTFCGSFNNTIISDEEEVTNFNGDGRSLATNIYCMDSDGSSVIRKLKRSILQDWSGSVINKTKTNNIETVQGEVCSNGNLTLQDCEINGNVRVRGNLTLKGNVTIKGYIACGGTINTNELNELSGCTDIYNDKMGGTGGGAGNLTLPNYVMYYYMDTPVTGDYTTSVVKYIDPIEKQLLNDGKYFTDGVFNIPEDNPALNPFDLKIIYTLNLNHHFVKEGEWAVNNIDHSRKYIVVENPTDYFTQDQESVESGDDKVYYGYVQSKCDKPNGNGGGFKGTTFNIEEFSCSIDTKKNKNEFTVQVDGRYFVVEFDPEAYTNERTFTIESKKASNGGGSGNTIKGIAVKSLGEFYTKENETSVYPEYARRPVIVGVETIDGINKDDTQVLKTMKGVTDMVNPYALKELPSALQAIHSSAKTYESLDKFKTINRTPDTFNYTSDSTNSNAYYIAESCIIDINTSLSNDIIINPNGSEMVIGINNLSMQSGKDILIDDSNGGNVYFYIENDGYFELNGSRILTKTYWDILSKDNWNAKISVGTPTFTDCTDITSEIPRAYLYGAEKSEFNVSNTKDMSLNIISPHIKLTMTGNDGKVSECYYNGYKMNCGNTPSLIGCCNIQQANMPNILNVIYIPRDGGPTVDRLQFDRLYWYDTLYYSEF